MARPGLLLYFDILPALDKLPHEAVGELLLKALHYAQDGNEPTFEDSSLTFAWAFLRPSIDRDEAAYLDKRQRGDWLTYCRRCKQSGEQPLDFETWRQRTDNGTLHIVDVALPTTTHNQPSSNTTPAPTQSQNQHHSDSAAQPLASTRDENGLIYLSDGDYEALQTELGAAELQRVITYLSSYCRLHGKTYPDWPFAIRKAAHEGWGKPVPGKGAPKGIQPGVDLQPDTKRIQQHNDWIDAFLEEQRRKEAASVGQ